MKKDYFISITNNDTIVISKNPNVKVTELTTFEDLNDTTKRYLYEIGQEIVTPFGIETIKSIDKNYSRQHGYEWLILVKENENQYKPCELIGIFVIEISKIFINELDSI